MAILEPRDVLKKMQNFSRLPRIVNLHSQAHARSILQSLNAPEAEWPPFQKDLEFRLIYVSHYKIWRALELLEVGESQEQAKIFLMEGAEALEFLYKNVISDSASRLDELFKAIFAYYIAGHYARSYVLMKETLETTKKIPEHLDLIAAIMRKDLKRAREITRDTFNNEIFTDHFISAQLDNEKIDDDTAISQILYYSICQAVSFYLEYIKTGELNILDKAFHIINISISLAKDSHFVDWWWWIYCLKFLFKEYSKTNLWHQIQPFADNEYSHKVISRYIHTGLRHTPPVIELWPTQVQSIPIINDFDRKHFCLKMPTSSGKTQIAELTILRFYLDTLKNNSKKCIYIAPFRSLAVEIENTLRNNLASLKIRVSEIYGGFEISPAERTLIEETQILVATPEKYDALFRYMPEIENEIGLIIIDEGHIIDPNERGLRFEFFIQRLLRHYKNKKCRFLFISAVLPNADEFSQWIAGSSEQLIQSNWRPSRLMLGKLTWNGSKVRIDYTHIEKNKFGQACFVPRFIEKQDCIGLSGIGRRQNSFPNDASEAFALSSLLFAREGTTLVFVPQKRQVTSLGKSILNALKIQNAISQSKGENFKLPTTSNNEHLRQRCKQIIESEIGTDSLLLEFLNNGFIVHHAGLPQRVRIAIEDLIRSNGVSLVIATSTLAQGVNLPIKTVLVRSLIRGYKDEVDSLQFWNICGRAGRGNKENEGQILFFVDHTGSDYQRRRQEKSINRVLDNLDRTKVISATRLLLQFIVNNWKNSHPNIDVAELCIHLASNSFEWVSNENKEIVRRWIDILDGHLLTLSEEFGIDPTNPDLLQEILEGSLLFIQLRNNPDININIDNAYGILRSRIQYIQSRYPIKATRFRLYKLGMSLNDCETIESHSQELYRLFMSSISWASWNDKERSQLLLEISSFILTLNDIKPIDISDIWPKILSYWIKGISISEIANDSEIKQIFNDQTEVSLFIEDICGYRLSWGINSLFNYLSLIATEKGESFHIVCSFFSGMVKYGVNNPIAICIMPYLDRKRDLSLIVANICPFGIENPKSIVDWFKNLSFEDLIKNGVERVLASKIIDVRDSFVSFDQITTCQPRSSNIRIRSKESQIIDNLSINDKILLFPRNDLSDRHYQIFTINGTIIGLYRHSDPIPQWWNELHLVVSTITDIEKTNKEEYILSIKINEI